MAPSPAAATPAAAATAAAGGAILVTGAAGQIGAELVVALRRRYPSRVVVAGINRTQAPLSVVEPVARVDVSDTQQLLAVVSEHAVDTVYHLAAVLSGDGERDPDRCFEANMRGLKNVLDVAKDRGCRVFWSSSIAVFGPSAPRGAAPQEGVLDPATFYGVTKVSGELMCSYYHSRWGLDVRALRYVGVITALSEPGDNVSDFACAMPRAALGMLPGQQDAASLAYASYLSLDTRMSWLYMEDCVAATIALMEAPSDAISVRTAYNVQSVVFSPADLAQALQRHVPGFAVEHVPEPGDNRQEIADSVPYSLDDSAFRRDTGWTPRYDLDAMVADVLEQLRALGDESEKKPAPKL